MPTAAQLAQRRRTTAAAARRRPSKPRPVPDAQRPTAIEQTYATMLARVLVQLDDVVREALRAARGDAADGDPPRPRPALDPKARRGLLRQMQDVLRKVTSRDVLLGPLDAIAAATADFSGKEFRRQVRAALGIDLGTAAPELTPQIKAFRDEGVSLIKSMARDKVSRVRTILAESGVSTRVEDIAERLQAEIGATPQKAALIARDQVLKLNGAVTAARHQAAGVTEYTWRTSRDERVRPEHRALEGKRFTYGDPPVVAKNGDRAEPGQYFQCRCTGSPVLEGFDEEVPAGERETGTSSPLQWAPRRR